MKKNKISRILFLSIAGGVILATLTLYIIIIINNNTYKILKNSKIYNLEENEILTDTSLNNYKLLVHNNEKIYFYNKKRKKILTDNSKIIKEVNYGEVSCDKYEEEYGVNLKCEETLDFFELFLLDKGISLIVDKDGNILKSEIEPDVEKKRNKYLFSYNYWYGNLKITQLDSNTEIYIKETYDSEGNYWLESIHKNENGKFESVVEIEDFYLDDEKYVEITNNQINIYKNGRLVMENKKYDKVYDIYKGYFLVLADKNLKLIDQFENVILDFGKFDIVDYKLRVTEREEKFFIKRVFSDGSDEIISFDLSGNFEYLEN